MESVSKSRLKRSTTAVASSGDFMNIADLKVKLKDKPARLAALLKTAPRVMCEFTGDELICDPKYDYKHVDEDIGTDEFKRRIDGEANLKADKAASAKKKAKTDKPTADGEVFDKPAKDLTDAQIKRIEKTIPILEDMAHKVTESLAVATSEDLKKWVPAGVLDRAREFKKVLEDLSSEFQDNRSEKKAVPAKLSSTFASGKATVKDTKEIMLQIKTLAGMAKGK